MEIRDAAATLWNISTLNTNTSQKRGTRRAPLHSCILSKPYQARAATRLVVVPAAKPAALLVE